jgi:hypothetical protein
MLHAGLDLSRERLDVRVLDGAGDTTLETGGHPIATDCVRSCSASGCSGSRYAG